MCRNIINIYIYIYISYSIEIINIKYDAQASAHYTVSMILFMN